MIYNFDERIERANTNCLKYDDSLKRFGKADVLPMWVADMDFKVAPAISEKFKEIVEHGIYGYHIKPAKYYQAIVDWFYKQHSFQVQSEGIYFTPGVVPALSYLIQAYTNPGDGVMVQSPVYYPFFWVIKQNNRQLYNNELVELEGRYTVDFDDFEEKAKHSKLFILCSPHNPVGRVWLKDELAKIAAICLKHNVLIISDEIHNDIVFSPNKHIPIASLSKEVENNTIICHSASKTFNLAGLSTAYVIINDVQLMSKFKNYMKTLYVDELNVFGLEGMVTAYNHCNDWLSEMLQYVKGNYNYLKEFLRDNDLRINVSELEATYLAWLSFKEYRLSNETLRNKVIFDCGLGLNDGPVFGDGGEGFQRINLACPRSILTEALGKIKMNFKDYGL